MGKYILRFHELPTRSIADGWNLPIDQLNLPDRNALYFCLISDWNQKTQATQFHSPMKTAKYYCAITTRPPFATRKEST